MKGEVDGVTLNEFWGWTKINDLGLKAAVEPLRRPLSIEGLHVLISKNTGAVPRTFIGLMQGLRN